MTEALTCYRDRAFRATIVMTWNLAYDHLLNWIMANHLARFNAAISVRYPKWLFRKKSLENKDDTNLPQ